MNQIQLYQLDGLGTNPRLLTESPSVPGGEIIEYAISPDGSRIAVAIIREDTSDTAVQLLDSQGNLLRVFPICDSAECTGLTWSPDSRRMLYEQRLLDPAGPFQTPRLWWLDTESGDTRPLIEGHDGVAYGAQFSPDGRWLAYVSPPDEGVVLVDLLDGQQTLLPSSTGSPSVWSPTGEAVLISDVGQVIEHGDDSEDHTTHGHDFQSAVHLFAIDDFSLGERRRISPDASVDDGGVPAWSPDGDWIVFGRRVPGTNSGRQLWLSQADGTDQRPLTDNAAYHYGAPSWSPDGRYLLFQRFPVNEPDARPDIAIIDLETGEELQVTRGAFGPRWWAGSEP